MGTDFRDDVETSPSSYDIKVHRQMCTALMKLVNRVSKIFPEIEAARPRCSSGLEELVLLSSAIDKAKSLLQYCSESSKLYLALTGDVILTRCKKARNLLQQSLSEIQNMVPVLLAAEISRIVADLRVARFSLDSSEEEAGKVLRELLHQYTPTPDSLEVALKAIQDAALRLHITSQKAILIEKRSIKKLLDKLGERETVKRRILSLFLNLLNKSGKVIVEQQKKNGFIQHEDHLSLSNSYIQSAEVESGEEHEPHVPPEAHINVLSQSAVPDEFKCPLSMRFMYDPVVIASGRTFERMWIQKWFDEGHDTCPKTGTKLANLSVTPNASMKDLILRWSAANGVTIPNPCLQPTISSFETSSNSIASLSSSMNDLYPVDFSDLSLDFSDVSHTSDTTRSKALYGLNKISTNEHEMDINALFKLDSLPWESQVSVVENIERLLKYNDKDWEFIPYQNLIQPIVKFLKHAHDLRDVKAQMIGCRLWLAFIKKCRTYPECISIDSYDLLASFVNIEVTKEPLSILEELSCHEHARYRIAASGAITPLLSILDNQTGNFHEPVLNILCNLTEDSEVCSLLVSPVIIAKLVPFLEEDTSPLARYSVTILKNISYKEDGRVCVAQTAGCIASLVKLLDSDNREIQEHAVTVLLSLCSQRIEYCQLVMDEGVIPGLVTISINGNDKGKSMAMELLRLLRDEIYDSGGCSGSDLEISTDSSNTSKERTSSSSSSSSSYSSSFSSFQTGRVFRKLSLFSKPTGRRKG